MYTKLYICNKKDGQIDYIVISYCKGSDILDRTAWNINHKIELPCPHRKITIRTILKKILLGSEDNLINWKNTFIKYTDIKLLILM